MLDCTSDVLDVLLGLHISHNHRLDDLARSLGMSMHAIGTLRLDQRIPTVIELRYVSAKVFDQGELSSGVLSFIAICVEDEVVENDKLLAALHLDIYHLRRVLLHICYIFVAHRVGQLVL